MSGDTLRTMVWRLLRTAIAAAIAQTAILQIDWSKPEEAFKLLFSSFIAGFLTALSVGVRDEFGDPNKDKGVINKLPV